MNIKSIYGLTLDQLIEWLLEHGHKKSRALQVWDWLYRKRVTSFSDMTDVNQECIQVLSENFAIQTLTEHIKRYAAVETVSTKRTM